MEIVLTVIGIYLVVGAILLSIFEMSTRRISQRIGTASTDAQMRMASSGTAVGSKAALILTFIVMWLFWPAVFVGAVKKEKKEGGNG